MLSYRCCPPFALGQRFKYTTENTTGIGEGEARDNNNTAIIHTQAQQQNQGKFLMILKIRNPVYSRSFENTTEYNIYDITTGTKKLPASNLIRRVIRRLYQIPLEYGGVFHIRLK